MPRVESSRTGEPRRGSHCHDRTAAPPLPIALPLRHCFVNTPHSAQGLKTLTLHGNGIENAPQYRFRVGCLVSKSLRTLDFSPLTIIDKDSASTWSKSQTPRGIRTPRR